MRHRLGRVAWRRHANAVMPIGWQTDFARSEKVESGACYEKASAGGYSKLVESHLVRSRVGFVETGALGCDDGIEIDAGASDRRRREFLGAVCNDAERHPFAAQRAEHFTNLRPGIELAVASGEQRRQVRRKSDLGRGL